MNNQPTIITSMITSNEEAVNVTELTAITLNVKGSSNSISFIMPNHTNKLVVWKYDTMKDLAKDLSYVAHGMMEEADRQHLQAEDSKVDDSQLDDIESADENETKDESPTIEEGEETDDNS